MIYVFDIQCAETLIYIRALIHQPLHLEVLVNFWYVHEWWSTSWQSMCWDSDTYSCIHASAATFRSARNNAAEILLCACGIANLQIISRASVIFNHARVELVKVSKCCPNFVMCLRTLEQYHEPPLYSIMREFRWSKSLNAAQILLYASESANPRMI